MKYKEGQKVKIVDNIYGHWFKIGSIGVVETVDYRYLSYDIIGEDGLKWVLRDKELEPID